GNVAMQRSISSWNGAAGSGSRYSTTPSAKRAVEWNVTSNAGTAAAIAATAAAVSSSTPARNGYRTVTWAGTPSAAAGSWRRQCSATTDSASGTRTTSAVSITRRDPGGP